VEEKGRKDIEQKPLGPNKSGEKQGGEQRDSKEPDAKRRRIDAILKGIEKREKETLAKDDGNIYAGDPIDWEPEVS
jgi:hypothetical protein